MVAVEQVGERYTGARVKRSEDGRILTGAGQYVDDIRLPGTLHVAFVRSPFAHARITGVDVEGARTAPGVVAVYTGEEIEAVLQPGPSGLSALVGTPPGIEFSALCTDKVRVVGDPVVMVVAESRYLAEDACELVEVDYDELRPVTTAAEALDPSSEPIFAGLGANVLPTDGPKVYGDVEGAFARADRVLTFTLDQHRHQNVPMEGRAILADYDAGAGKMTIHAACQGVQLVRMTMANRLGMSPDDVHVLASEIGGSFGLKFGVSREEIAVVAASRDLGRPVKWIEDRNENLTVSGQAREESFEVEAAVTGEGRILGLKVKMIIDTGAYPGMGARVGAIIEGMLPGPYRLEGLTFEEIVTITNKATYVAYRGPWAGETYVRERLIDLVAAELGREPLEVRLANVARVVPGEEPPTMVTGRPLSGLTAHESLTRAGEVADLPAFRRRQEAARAEGRYLGLGMATYIEAAPGPRAGGREQAKARLEADGTVVVYTSQMPHGQGHQTTMAQIVADEFGVPFEDVRIVVGDTDVVPAGITGGSRSATMAGGAALNVGRALRSRVLDLASHLLEASADDLVLAGGEVSVRGVPASARPLAAIAAELAEPGRLPDGVDPSVEVDVVYEGGEGGWSGGTHCVVLEVDPGTGLVEIDRYVVIEDCGEPINPAIVDGQVRGGVAQGIGAVLLERSAYDGNGQFLSGSFMDYLLPTTTEVPRIEIRHLDPVRLDPDVNFRGVGEGGMIVAPVTVVNAIADALRPFGVGIVEPE
jgi:carbon-monoxide dehydrogenase large subunit